MATGDLVTAGEVSVALPNLTPQQSLQVDTLIGATSVMIAAKFARAKPAADYEEVLDGGQGRTLMLGRRPVLAIERVSTDLAGVLAIACTDGTAARATVAVQDDGDADRPAATGLMLAMQPATGGAVQTTIDFASNQDVQQVADAINDLTGWTATVTPGGETVQCEDIPTTQGPISARRNPATIRAWTRDLADWSLDRKRGELTIYELRPDSFRWPDRKFGVDPRMAQVRVAYRAGLAVITPDVKQAAFIILKDLLDRTKIGAISYEWSPEYAFRLDVTTYQIPPAATALLSRYKDRMFS